MKISISILKDSEAEWPNLTPLIDVTFLLIIFFILTGVYASATHSTLVPPKLADTEKLDEIPRQQRIIINIVPYSPDEIGAEADLAGQAAAWVVAGRRIMPGNESALAEAVQKVLAADAETIIQLRADRNILFSQIEPVIATLARSGINSVNYVAEPDGAKLTEKLK